MILTFQFIRLPLKCIWYFPRNRITWDIVDPIQVADHLISHIETFLLVGAHNLKLPYKNLDIKNDEICNDNQYKSISQWSILKWMIFSINCYNTISHLRISHLKYRILDKARETFAFQIYWPKKNWTVLKCNHLQSVLPQQNLSMFSHFLHQSPIHIYQNIIDI